MTKVFINSNVKVLKQIRAEIPCTLRSGIYEIEKLGAYTYLGGRSTFAKHIGEIGRFCSIASNLIAGETEHPVDNLSTHPVLQGAFPEMTGEFNHKNADSINQSIKNMRQSLGVRMNKIKIGNDVWIGEGVFLRRGVTIGDGAVVGSRSVVTKDVKPYEIVGGTPARHIRWRFPSEIIGRLLATEWWLYGLEALQDLPSHDIERSLDIIERRITERALTFYNPSCIKIEPNYYSKDTVLASTYAPS